MYCQACKETHENCLCEGYAVICSYDGFDFATGFMGEYASDGKFAVNIDGDVKFYYGHTVTIRREDGTGQ